MMRRLSILLLCSAFVTLATAPRASLAMDLPLQLKSGTTITDDVIRVGDIWENAGDKAQMAIAVAPQPGKRVTLDIRWLTNLASRNDLDWHPTTQFDRTVIERAGQSIDVSAVETELREALELEGLAHTSTIEISNRQALSIMIPTDSKPTIAIKDLAYDARTQRFSALVETPAGSPAATRIKVVGRTMTTTRIPVLNRAMNRGETITAQDVTWELVRDENLHQDLLIDPNQLIGMEPRHLLKANAAIRLADLQRPMAVNRGGLVTMILQTPFMTLTAQGTAMEDGGVGEIVRVTNLQTKQVVEAKVQAQGTVLVAASQASAKQPPRTAAVY